VFGGYNRYSSWLGAHSTAPRSWRGLAGWMTRKTGHPDSQFLAYARHLELFSPAEKRERLAPEWMREFEGYDDYWSYRQHWRSDLEPATRLQYLDLKTYLPDDILTKVDRASMAASLEVRPPLLDHELVELLLALPADVRTPEGQPKFLLKLAAKHLLPGEIVHRPKRGFSAPWTAWMAANADWAKHELSASTPQLFRTNLAADPTMPRYGEKVWAAMLADQWLRRRA
jgi:asparagine synthetase B (glutamine-hydrolysing)